jgi:signal transduction histidine kinase
MADVQATFADRTFDLLCSSDLPTSVEMDGELIALSLVNLLTNAAKYSPRDDVVQLEVSVDEMLHYRFRDRGPGLSAQEQTRLFNVFQRSPSSRGEVGFGIGLAIVKRVAEVHGGALTYVDRPGGGAQFSLSLPLSPAKGLAT